MKADVGRTSGLDVNASPSPIAPEGDAVSGIHANRMQRRTTIERGRRSGDGHERRKSGRSLYRAARPRLYAALVFRNPTSASWYASALRRFNRDAVKCHCQ